MERSLGSSYVLEVVIGQGALGQVWQGRDRAGQRFAFRLLRPELTADPRVVQSLVRGRPILTSIEHPNVVSMYDLVLEGDSMAIVMELVEGGTLRTMLSLTGTLPPAKVAELGAGIAAGLEALHAADIIHRDVRPENVLIDTTFSPGLPRLTDYGIATLVHKAAASGRGTVLAGTPQYLSPVLLDGQEATESTDLYALGAVLYELVCGITPFPAGTTLVLRPDQRGNSPARPPVVPDSLWDVITWLLGRQVFARPRSARYAATLLDSLVPTLVGLPPDPARGQSPTPLRE